MTAWLARITNLKARFSQLRAIKTADILAGEFDSTRL